MIVLETKRLILREWVPDDWKRFKPLATDPRVLRYIGDGTPWPDEKIKEGVEKWISLARSRGWILWAVIHRDDAELIGFCGFSYGFAPDVEIGWRLLPDYWGHALATEAARATLDYGFRRWRFARVISVAQPENRASVRVMEKIGMIFDESFVHEGIPVVRYVAENPYHSGLDVSEREFTIRRARDEDAGAIAEVYNEAIRNTTATFDTEPKSVKDRMRWLQSRDARHPVIVAEFDGQVIGWAALSQWSDRPAYTHTAESSFYVKEQFRGKGVGRMLKVRLIDEARRAGFHTIIARVAEGSDASIHLNQSVGFAHVGTLREVGFKFGRRLDVHLMQLMLNDTPLEES